MKPVDVKSGNYVEYNVNSNDKDPKFKINDHVGIPKIKTFLLKAILQYWSEEVFVIKEVKSTVPWTYVISDLNGEKTIGTFYEKELQKANQQEFRIEKVIKRKGNKLFVKWKGYNNSFNSWIDKKNVM